MNYVAERKEKIETKIANFVFCLWQKEIVRKVNLSELDLKMGSLK